MRFRPVLTSALIFAFCVSAFAQDLQLYDFGKLEEIRGMRRVYVGPRRLAANRDIDAIEYRIRGKHGLRVLRHGSVADFMLHFQYLPDANTSTNSPDGGSTASLQVYQVRNNVVFILWTREQTAVTSRTGAARYLADAFLKDFGEMNRKK
jgi:hypothetical protein